MSYSTLAWFTVTMINRQENPTYDKFLAELAEAVAAR